MHWKDSKHEQNIQETQHPNLSCITTHSSFHCSFVVAAWSVCTYHQSSSHAGFKTVSHLGLSLRSVHHVSSHHTNSCTTVAQPTQSPCTSWRPLHTKPRGCPADLICHWKQALHPLWLLCAELEVTHTHAKPSVTLS